MALQLNTMRNVEIIINKINLMFKNGKINLIIVRHDGDNYVIKYLNEVQSKYPHKETIIPDFIFENMALGGYTRLTGKELYSIMEDLLNRIEFHSDKYKFFIPNKKFNAKKAIDFELDIDLFNSNGQSFTHSYKGYHAKMLIVIFKMLFDKDSQQGNFKNSMFQQTIEILFNIFNRKDGYKSIFIDSYFGSSDMAFHIAQELNKFIEQCNNIQKSRFFLNGVEYNSVDYWDYD